jgi:putative transposase
VIDYITPEQVASLEGVSLRHVQRKIKNNIYGSKKVASKKHKGKFTTEIAVSSLPPQVQAKILIETGTESQFEKIEKINTTPSELGAWYLSLRPEHLTLIEKRLAIIESIGRVVESSSEKNKTQLIIDYCENFRISKDTYYRWKKSYDKDGLYGLRVKAFGVKRIKLNEGQCKYILSLIRFNPDCRDTRIWEYLVDEFPNNIVSGSTVTRFVRKWKMDNPDVFEWLRNPDAWKNKYALAFGSQSEKAHHFLHYVELDSTPADLMCNDGKRYTIIGGIDIYSRKVKCYVSPSSSGMGVAGLIRSIITGWGVPENFVRDNGKDYVCNQINLAFETLGVNAITLPPFSPEKKPHIERFFRTMAMCLFEETSGYVGHNVADRKAIESRRTFAQRLMKQGDNPIRLNLTPEDLQDLINRWLENKYHQREHTGIRTTPEIKAAQSTTPVRMLEDERALDILLLPCGTRTVQSCGIGYERGKYQSPLFAGWVGKRVNVRRNIDNAGLLYVFDMQHNFICTAVDQSLNEMSSSEYVKARKEQKVILREKVNAIEVLTESPMERQLRKSKVGKKLISLNGTTVHSTQALEEAKNAALEKKGIKPDSYKTVAEQMNDGESFDSDFDDNDPLAFMENLNIVYR